MFFFFFLHRVSKVLSVFERGSDSYKARIKPNYSNQIALKGLTTQTFKTMDHIRSVLGCGTRMDSKIVKRSLSVLDKVEKEEIERAQSNVLIERIDKLEEMLRNITNCLTDSK